jgi:hypothetical protein
MNVTNKSKPSNSKLSKTMNRLYWIIIIIGLISCSRLNYQNKYIKELPDSTLINDVISCVIQMDSLDQNYKLSKEIMIPLIYNWTKSDQDSLPPPPPPPFSISYGELYTHFDAENEINKKSDDSIFIKLQINNNRNVSVSNDLVKKFNNNSNGFYLFNLPIFSFKRQFVFIQYWKHCGELCGGCHQILLKKVSSKWIKVNKWSCGVS